MSLSRQTSETSSESEPSDSLPSESEKKIDTVSSILREEADKYMLELIKGDSANTASVFGYREAQVLSPTYEFDDMIYRLYFENVSYSYTTCLTSDHANYELDVTCHFPDLYGAIQYVKDDFIFMYENASDWINAVVGEDRELEDQLLNELSYTILFEAINRIQDGSYREETLITGYFLFHDNGDGNWVCEKTPDFVTILGDADHMLDFTLIDPLQEYSMIEDVGAIFVATGTISQDALDAALIRKIGEIAEMQG